MANQRLRDALLRRGVTLEKAAEHAGVDAKTVSRWLTTGRHPYPKHRHALAAMLHESESYLWPDALDAHARSEVDQSEVVSVYPNRNAVPAALWSRLLATATARIDVLVYAGMFLTEDPAYVVTLRAKAHEGAKVRLLLGDPASREVVRRSEDEGIGQQAIPVKIRNALAFFRQLDGAENVAIRCHGTTLYNSLYRYDDNLIVNSHVYGIPAPHAPAVHLRRLSAGSIFETYMRSFEAVWSRSEPPAWD